MKAKPMKSSDWSTAAVVILAMLIAACGGDGRGDGGNGGPGTTSAAADTGTTLVSGGGDGGWDRQTMVLCEAIEEHADDLADIIGFDVDTDREIQTFFGECTVRSVREQSSWARVQLQPAIISSVADQAGLYEGEVSPAPELGSDAVHITDASQPQVIFELEGHIFAVNAQGYIEAPPRETMIELALRIRAILIDANS